MRVILCSALTQVAGADHHLFRIKARHALWSVPDSNGTEQDLYRNLSFSSRHRRCQQDSNLHLLLFLGRMRFFHQRRHPIKSRRNTAGYSPAFRIASASCSLNDVFLWKDCQAVLQTLTFFSVFPTFSMRNDQFLYSSFFLNCRMQA